MSQIERCVNPLAELLLRFEGECLKPYRCAAGVPTIGVGATSYPDGRPVTMRDAPITVEQSRQMLREECNKYLTKVESLLKDVATDGQLLAMTSLAYNIGIGAFGKSTVLKAHNAGDTAAASRAFHLWNKARVNGKLTPLKGLTARRAAESAMYLREDENPFPEAPVQAVAVESKLVASPINAAGATGAATGVTALASGLLGDTAPVVAQAKNIAESIGIDPLVALGVVILVAGVMSMVYRYKQRAGGWA